MLEPGDIHSLTEFQRNTKAALRRLRRRRRPEVLTVNGKAAVIVQDADAYVETIRKLEGAYTVEAVRVALEQAQAGKGVPVDEAFQQIRARRTGERKRRTA